NASFFVQGKSRKTMAKMFNNFISESCLGGLWVNYKMQIRRLSYSNSYQKKVESDANIFQFIRNRK
ncbi:MAG: hypothetical protein ACK5DG_02510, partial [Chitinophagaceae bacterium]